MSKISWGQPHKVAVLFDGRWIELGIMNECDNITEPVDVFSELIAQHQTPIHFSFSLPKQSRKQRTKFEQFCGLKKKPKFTYKTNKKYFKK